MTCRLLPDVLLQHGGLSVYPPSRLTMMIYPRRLCVVHNQVNERLKKPEFDCAHLDATYDCGCGDDPVTPVAPDRGVHDDPMDPVGLQHEPVKDDKTGAGLIRGG